MVQLLVVLLLLVYNHKYLIDMIDKLHYFKARTTKNSHLSNNFLNDGRNKNRWRFSDKQAFFYTSNAIYVKHVIHNLGQTPSLPVQAPIMCPESSDSWYNQFTFIIYRQKPTTISVLPTNETSCFLRWKVRDWRSIAYYSCKYLPQPGICFWA